MIPQIKKIKNTELKMIVIGLITSDLFCKEIIPILLRNKDLMYQCFDSFYRVVLNWILDYYKKYNTSPKKHIKDIYEKETQTLSEEQSEMIGLFLSDLNDKYEREDHFNEQYAIDQAKLYLREKNIAILELKIKEAKQNGQIEEAENLIYSYRQIERETDLYQITDIFDDIDDIDDCINEKEDKLFRLPGVLGNHLGYFIRGDFIAVAGPAKRGKSWHLEEIAVRGMLKNLRVLYFNLEMSHSKCRKRIYQNFLGEVLKIQSKDSDFDVVSIPYFEDTGNGKFQVVHKEKKKYGIKSNKIKMKINALKKMSKGNLRIITFPTNSLTLKKMEHVSDEMVLDGFVPDVVVIDYADIMVSEQKSEHRHQIDDKWKGLRGFAQKKHCLVVTGSHAAKSTFKKDIGQDNITEDYRKMNHVTMMYGLNQTGVDIDENIMRINILAHRDKRFNPDNFIIVLQCLDIGKCYLDSKDKKDVDFSNRKSK